jgi:hypothetical protein
MRILKDVDGGNNTFSFECPPELNGTQFIRNIRKSDRS